MLTFRALLQDRWKLRPKANWGENTVKRELDPGLNCVWFIELLEPIRNPSLRGMATIKLSFKNMLEEIVTKLGFPNPVYGSKVEANGQVRSFVEMNRNVGSVLFEVIKVWGPIAQSSMVSKQQAAMLAIEELKWLGLEIRDMNYDKMSCLREFFLKVHRDYSDLLIKH
ncbi:uncharacterized protein LOC131164494 isoform X3 [Malania oleifera]|uniref:uncharacterized protein LOC131164494 isoform X3 n=1 Tax=Malania oleifera TaxID=397392 RepID=UPI0025AEA42F|nr:uncharacterized protein LOC131164494 isoform X3 [Malania oleifera]XP_057977721.1 uncharacterized protein LOC131164494 isoform X3 [Malania oleifera]